MPKLPETDDFVVDLRKIKEQAQPRGIPARPPASLVAAPLNIDSEQEEENQPRHFFKSKDAPQMKSWLDFIQYNNAFLVLLVIGVIAFGGLTFASEEVRDATIGGQKVYAEGVDNTILLRQDFSRFNMDFKITGIVEDEESYVVGYSYVDFDLTSPLTPLLDKERGTITSDGAIPSPYQGEGARRADEAGNVWQFVEKQASRKIDKPFRQDLGLYLAEQLRQEATARLKELKNLQAEERAKGETKIVQVTEYSGLIGKVLDLSAAVFPGYEPVKKVELPTPAADEQIALRTQSGGSDNLTNIYNNWVAENSAAVAELNAGEITPATTTAETAGTSEEGRGTEGEQPAANAPSAGTAEPIAEPALVENLPAVAPPTIEPETPAENAPAENAGTATTPAEMPAGQ
ncbi:hypothetical protein COU01_03665 [Candidatus Falkowbacteria bacterium CG10_big_fil_rev_8_21_14_0_10_44_15]|uniref:Uncharacterized protein n=1 Tax=Candidatus Falkowbacteria bacterium CG10_big_fil_rev_8_21_14_0_10_44_15 TaxID=1974569 RepID=A0A2H0UZ52_9BACT|nr:MAG: hypothetical protein COU01_03665 [Candidatus Falkowbacteria bacterium CG10_big_fil_rev_8_21_14_0_10_44_15]